MKNKLFYFIVLLLLSTKVYGQVSDTVFVYDTIVVRDTVIVYDTIKAPDNSVKQNTTAQQDTVHLIISNEKNETLIPISEKSKDTLPHNQEAHSTEKIIFQNKKYSKRKFECALPSQIQSIKLKNKKPIYWGCISGIRDSSITVLLPGKIERSKLNEYRAIIKNKHLSQKEKKLQWIRFIYTDSIVVSKSEIKKIVFVPKGPRRWIPLGITALGSGMFLYGLNAKNQTILLIGVSLELISTTIIPNGRHINLVKKWEFK